MRKFYGIPGIRTCESELICFPPTPRQTNDIFRLFSKTSSWWPNRCDIFPFFWICTQYWYAYSDHLSQKIISPLVAIDNIEMIPSFSPWNIKVFFSSFLIEFLHTLLTPQPLALYHLIENLAFFHDWPWSRIFLPFYTLRIVCNQNRVTIRH